MASLTDILSALQNGVVAINTLAGRTSGLYNNLAIASLFQGPVTTSYTVLYTSASNSASHIDDILFCNTTGSAITISMSIVAPGGTASASNAIFFGLSIPANSTLTWTGRIIVPAGYTVQALASGAGLTLTISGGTSV
jgi:hypothetical protein